MQFIRLWTFFPLKPKYNFSWKRFVVWDFLESAGNLKQPHSANMFFPRSINWLQFIWNANEFCFKKSSCAGSVKVENFAVSFDAYSWIKEFFALNHMVYVHDLVSVQNLIIRPNILDNWSFINSFTPDQFEVSNFFRGPIFFTEQFC